MAIDYETDKKRVLKLLEAAGGQLASSDLAEEMGHLERNQRSRLLARMRDEGLVTSSGLARGASWSLAKAGKRPKKSTPSPAPPASAAAVSPSPAAGQAAAPATTVGQHSDSPGPREAANRAAPVADRFALRDRLLAIAGDVQDALDDACAAELPHSLIRHLVAANGAAHRALLALPA